MKYPEWVYQYKEKGTSLKKVGDNFYLYRTTSRRVPGKKNPQPVCEYIGVVTKEGVIKTGRFVVDPSSGVEVHEYGFSRTLELVAPDAWRRHFKTRKEADAVIAEIACAESRYSYLAPRARPGRSSAATARHRMALEEALGYGLGTLDMLKGIFIVELEGRHLVSRITEEEQELLDRLGVDLWKTTDS